MCKRVRNIASNAMNNGDEYREHPLDEGVMKDM